MTMPKPCPLCDWPAMAMQYGREWAVYCNNDGTVGKDAGATCGIHGPSRPTEAEAVAAWDLRGGVGVADPAPAQVGTHPKGEDAKQASGDSLSDAVAEGHAPERNNPFKSDTDGEG